MTVPLTRGLAKSAGNLVGVALTKLLDQVAVPMVEAPLMNEANYLARQLRRIATATGGHHASAAPTARAV